MDGTAIIVGDIRFVRVIKLPCSAVAAGAVTKITPSRFGS